MLSHVILAALVGYIAPLLEKELLALPLIEAARKQVGVTLTYDPAYTSIPYPMGDVAQSKGVCTDVIVRAFRAGLSIDLQRAIHEDMKKRWSAYPKSWGLSRPDPNIDHRRVPNLRTFFAFHKLAVSNENWTPGDIVVWTVLGRPHIEILSNKATKGTPLVIHNIGEGTQEEDVLFSYSIVAHFRLTPAFIAWAQKNFSTPKALAPQKKPRNNR